LSNVLLAKEMLVKGE